jgi:Arylsulfotransferase (ASST)
MAQRWRFMLVVVGVAIVGAGALIATADGQTTTSAQIGAFPMPGTQSASPDTQISLRGAPVAQLGTITVTGSHSGRHAGTLRPHSDGQGASFVLNRPLEGNEEVTVATDLKIPGARDGDYTFHTVTRPSKGLQSSGSLDPKLLQQLIGQKGDVPRHGVTRYESRPDLRPPEIEVRRAARSTEPGYIFLAPKKVFGARERPGLQSGPLIVDDAGEPVWFAPTGRATATDFRVQQYQGRPVLTWWQGRTVLGTGEGVVQIADASFRPVKTVRGGNGYQLDFHEARLTPQGTLLAIVYNPVRRDLRFAGGPRNARVIDSVVQEIDITTGLVMFEWHSLGTIALSESHGEIPRGADPLYDYVHANSVALTADGNVLVSGRETWAAYKLERATGRLLARIGGKRSSYRMRGTSQTAWQHDVEQQADGSLTIFDNEAAPRVREQSRGLVLHLDDQAKQATVRDAFIHKPDPLLSGTQGNVQVLGNEHMFVGWGSQGYFSEFAPDGTMVFDARIARGSDTYRAYRYPFVGTPRGRPAVAAQDGGRSVYASWNGATQVARWQVLAGAAPTALTAAGAAARDGFETRIRLRSGARYVAVQALDASGAVLGTSRTVRSSS